MILVILGTQNMPFDRLLKAIDNQIKIGNIKDEVIVQAGSTKFESQNMEIFDLIPSNKFDELLKKADLIISHAGVGSILGGITLNKKMIIAARDKKYGEHVNNHQFEILDQFENDGYILGLHDFDTLDILLKQVKTFNPKKYVSNQNYIISKIEEFIENH